MDLLSPDDVASAMSSPFFVKFWPLLLGATIILIFLLRGYTRTTLPLAAVFAVLQAWHMGFFGEK